MRLSGGQLRRVAAARMFVRQPELLAFDDISSSLDIRTEHELWSRLLRSCNRRTCLAVSHRLATFEQATQILVLKDGQLVGHDSFDELLRTSAEMRYLAERLEINSG